MVMLDPFNTRSVGFQVMALKDHLAALPSLLDDGILETPNLAADVLRRHVTSRHPATL